MTDTFKPLGAISAPLLLRLTGRALAGAENTEAELKKLQDQADAANAKAAETLKKHGVNE